MGKDGPELERSCARAVETGWHLRVRASCEKAAGQERASMGQAVFRSPRVERGAAEIFEHIRCLDVGNTVTATAAQFVFVRYLQEPPVSKDSDPLLFWKVYSNRTLADLAIRYLTIIATSVPSERLFSTAGLILSQNRNRLTP